MEVKADERVPQWVASLLARHNCQIARVSKYCAGVAQLGTFKSLPLQRLSGLIPELPHG
jgi:SPX domain protein involved in polyphosphate accumulation